MSCEKCGGEMHREGGAFAGGAWDRCTKCGTRTQCRDLRIDALWAWVSTDSEDGCEGLFALYIEKLGAWVPAVGASLDRMRQLEPHVIDVCKRRGIKARLVRFHGREQMEEVG